MFKLVKIFFVIKYFSANSLWRIVFCIDIILLYWWKLFQTTKHFICRRLSVVIRSLLWDRKPHKLCLFSQCNGSWQTQQWGTLYHKDKFRYFINGRGQIEFFNKADSLLSVPVLDVVFHENASMLYLWKNA